VLETKKHEEIFAGVAKEAETLGIIQGGTELRRLRRDRESRNAMIQYNLNFLILIYGAL
jgi:hypothetical protein